jgi:hypothetical protein
MYSTAPLLISSQPSLGSMGFFSFLKIPQWECCKCLKKYGIVTLNPGTAAECSRQAFKKQNGKKSRLVNI